MIGPSLARRLRAGETVLSGWTHIADPFVAEAVARCGFPAVCMDAQHGYAGFESVKASLLGCVAGGAAPIVRVPHHDLGFASRALDLGAEALIAPMVNSSAESKLFAEAAKYPPYGERSWGPSRPIHAWGMDRESWLAEANGLQLSFAMIETHAAVAAAGEIAAVEGIDGLFIGPADMSVSASRGAAMNPESDSVLAAMDAVAAACKTHGKFAGGYAQTPGIAAEYRARGFLLIACGSDYGFIRSGAADALRRFSS